MTWIILGVRVGDDNPILRDTEPSVRSHLWYHDAMAKKTVVPKKKRGPPPTGVGRGLHVRLQPPAMTALDAWIADQPEPQPSRPEAIRRLIALGLTVKSKSRQATDPSTGSPWGA
jgi:hypothetical protein